MLAIEGLEKPTEPSAAVDALVVGAGLAGLAAAIGLARAGFETILAGAPESPVNGRTVALLDGSVRFLEGLGVWDEAAPRAAALRVLRLVDDTGGLFRAPTVEFFAREIGLDAFGWNIENAALIETLGARAAACPGLTRAGRIVSCQWDEGGALARCEDGRAIAARLVVGADGRASWARTAADIPVRARRLPQAALTAILAHGRPHKGISTEFHTRQGPFTLVPLPAGRDGAHRSSLVWVTSEAEATRRRALEDAAFALEAESQAQSILGAMRVAGGRGAFPLTIQSAARLTARRLALVGDAAHVLPPIGAQGLNLGLRDVADLIAAARATQAAGGEIGGPRMLADYENARRPDVALRAGAVNALNHSLLAGFAPADLARSAGLAALGAFGPLRRLVMREGVAPRRFGQTSGERAIRSPAGE